MGKGTLFSDDGIVFAALFLEMILACAMYALGRLHGRHDRLEAFGLGFDRGYARGEERGFKNAQRGVERQALKGTTNELPVYARQGGGVRRADVPTQEVRALVGAGTARGGAGRHHRE